MFQFQEIEFASRCTYTLFVGGVAFASFINPSAMAQYVGETYGSDRVILSEIGTPFSYFISDIGGGVYLMDLIEPGNRLVGLGEMDPADPASY